MWKAQFLIEKIPGKIGFLRKREDAKINLKRDYLQRIIHRKYYKYNNINTQE